MDNNTIQNLTERMFIFLEDKTWSKASEYAERILDLEPKNAQAYLGKLMLDYKVSNKEQLQDLKHSFEQNTNYKRAIQYGDEILQSELQNYLSVINKRKESSLTQKNSSPVIAAFRNNKSLLIIIPLIAILLICSIVGIVLPLQSKENNSPNETISYDKNWIEYESVTVRIPSNAKYTASVSNGKIYLKGQDIPTINQFLSYLQAPKGKTFYATDGFASSNGNTSFIIKNYRTANVQYYFDYPFEKATLDLIFCGYSSYNARFLSSDGRMPLYISGSNNGMLGKTDDNSWKNNVQFMLKETTLVGQYYDANTKTNSTTISITIVVE